MWSIYREEAEKGDASGAITGEDVDGLLVFVGYNLLIVSSLD